MKIDRIFHIIIFCIVLVLADANFHRSTAHASGMQPNLYYSDYFKNFYDNYNNLFAADTGAVQAEQAKDAARPNAKPSADVIFGKLHKGFGYTTLALGILSMGFGIWETYEYSRGAAPHKAVQIVHDFSSNEAVMFALGSVITGFIAYWDVFNFKNGANTINSHALLGVIATTAIVATAIMGWVEGDDLREKEGFPAHCGMAAGAGTALMISIIVVQF